MLHKSNSDSFDRIYDILEKSFPPDELRPYIEQASLLLDMRYSILSETQNGKIAAFFAIWEFDTFIFIEHFATHPDFRNLGLGSQMLRELTEISKKPLCLEVEPPDCDVSRRRIEFYKRNGFHLNHYHYMQPPISKGRKTIPLMIMTSPSPITESEFENIKATLYSEVYKV